MIEIPLKDLLDQYKKYLEEIWNCRDELIGKEATVKYFNLTPDGQPRFPKVINIGRGDYE